MQKIVNYHQDIIDLVEDGKNFTYHLLNLPNLWKRQNQLRIRVIGGGSKLLIFCCLKNDESKQQEQDQEQHQEKITPAIITVEGLNQSPPSPNMVVNAQKVTDYFTEENINVSKEELGFFFKVCLNDNENEALIFPKSDYMNRSLDMVKLNLDTCKISFKKALTDHKKYGVYMRLEADIDNQGYPYKGVLVELHPVSYGSIYSDQLSFFTFNPKTELFRKVFVLNKYKSINGEKRTQRHSWGKIDRKAFHRKRDCLAYFRFFSESYYGYRFRGSLEDENEKFNKDTDMSYVNFHS